MELDNSEGDVAPWQLRGQRSSWIGDRLDRTDRRPRLAVPLQAVPPQKLLWSRTGHFDQLRDKQLSHRNITTTASSGRSDWASRIGRLARSSAMRPAILFHPQLRSLALPRWLRRDLSSRLSARFKTTLKEIAPSKQPSTLPPAPTSPKTTVRRGRKHAYGQLGFFER